MVRAEGRWLRWGRSSQTRNWACCSRSRSYGSRRRRRCGSCEPWRPPLRHAELGVVLDSTDPETSYLSTREAGGYRYQVRSRGEIIPNALYGRYEDAVKSISLILGSSFRSSLRWGSLTGAWGDDVPPGIVASDCGHGVTRYSLEADPGRFLQTSWEGARWSRILTMTLDELNETLLAAPRA